LSLEFLFLRRNFDNLVNPLIWRDIDTIFIRQFLA
jgi:hypothetical protein